MIKTKFLGMVALSALLCGTSVFASKVWKTGLPTFKVQNQLQKITVLMDMSIQQPNGSLSNQLSCAGVSGAHIADFLTSLSNSSHEETTFQVFKIYDAKTKKSLPNCDMMQNPNFNPGSKTINIQLKDSGCVVTKS